MEESLYLLERCEYSVTVENVMLRLLIDKQRNPAEKILSHVQHTHGYTELFACGRGSLTLQAGDKLIRLAAGDLAIVPAELPHHKLSSESDSVWCAVGILLMRRRTRSTSNLYRKLAGLCCAPQIHILRDCADVCGVVLEIADDTAADSCLPALAMTTLLTKLADTAVPLSSDISIPPPADGEINRIAQLEHIITVCYTSDMTADEIAARLFISPRQLARLVRRRYGTTLHRAILEQRVETAAQLLRESDQSAEQIGLAVGFRSKSCFYHAFREAYGMTPAEYRVKMRQQDS